MSEIIQIHLYIPGQSIININVSPFSPLNIIKSFIKCNNLNYIFNGNILNPQYSFSQCNIKNKDTIIVLTPHRAQIEIGKWLQITHDSDFFLRHIEGILNKSTNTETARLLDFQILKMERKKGSFQKLCSFINMNNQKLESEKKESTNINFEEPSAPSLEPLPPLWDQ